MVLGMLAEYKRVLTMHHLVNVLLCISFYFTKVIPVLCQFVFRGEAECHIDHREHQIMIFLAFVIFWKNRRATSWYHYMSTVFVFTKLANLMLFYYVDPRVALIYGLICIGPEKIVYFRGPHLKDELERDPRVTWLIEFYVAWSPECSQVASVFAQLSDKYTLPNLKFAKLDVGRYGEEAERFRINTHPTSRQLPTFSLFRNETVVDRNGKEVKRRPVVSAQGRAVRYVFSKENVIMDFDLNNLYEECKAALPKFEKNKKPKDSEQKKTD